MIPLAQVWAAFTVGAVIIVLLIVAVLTLLHRLSQRPDEYDDAD